MDLSKAFDKVQFNRVSDLSKEEFEQLLNACFEEFLHSSQLKDAAFSCAEQVMQALR